MENAVGNSLDLNDLPGEEWKIVPGFENRYYISNYSRVLDTYKGERILHKYDYGNRYVVRLKDRRGILHYFNDYILTAKNFLPNDPLRTHVKLRDGNYKNGHISNLYYGKKEFKSGPDHHRSKLVQSQIIQIIIKRSNGLKLKDIAHQFNVSIETISKVVNRKYYNL
jgi:hypothetical protein